MLILKESTYTEFMVKNSRFAAEAEFVDSPESAKEIWRARKELYSGCNHVVYALLPDHREISWAVPMTVNQPEQPDAPCSPS